MTDNLHEQMEAAIQRRVRAPVAAVMKRLTLEAFTRVVQRSPVDSGRFRANWQVGVGTRPDGQVAGTDLQAQGSPPDGAAVNAALGALTAVGPATDATYVVNNLPYADALENGHSKQAPQGMVEVTVAELRQVASLVAKQVVRS